MQVVETGQGRLTQRIRTATHERAADEPIFAGGNDTAPHPNQLLLSALGACTSMTIRMYVERKGWDLRRISVTLTHDRLHAADCAQCETSGGRLDRIVREIHLDGDLDDTRRARLLAIARPLPGPPHPAVRGRHRDRPGVSPTAGSSRHGSPPRPRRFPAEGIAAASAGFRTRMSAVG